MAQFNFIGKKIEILKGEGWNGNIEFIAPPINLYEGHYSYLFETGAIQEYRIKINDKVYGNEAFKDAINLQENLFDKSTFTVGSFTISVLKAKLMVPSEEIPHNASVVFSYRYNDGEIQSEWVERFKGKVTKRTKYTDEVTTIEAKDRASNYDVFLDYFGDEFEKYPANTRKVAQLCANHLGLTIENINDVIDLDIVEYPNELTMVEMLKNIARNSGGNWVIIGDNLRLVTTGTYKNEVDYPAQSIETSSLLNPISKILMYYADEKAFESGDDTGSTLEIDSPWGTQESTNYVYSVLNGYEYVPIKVSGAYIDPAIELGDIISIDGHDVLVANVKWIFDGIVAADIEVPINNEENYDDPYNTLVQNQFKRKVSLGDSYQGVTISRDKGIEMLVSPDGTEENAIGRYYADLYRGIAFQTRDNKNQEWHDWMYFDLEEKTFKMHIIEEIQEEIDNIELTPGPQGPPGKDGKDGKTYYTWVKYADGPNGEGISDSAVDKTYIGLAFNKETEVESTDPKDYEWSLLPQHLTVGGRNLILDSKYEVKNNCNYLVRRYDLSEPFIENEKYTFSMRFRNSEIGTRDRFWVYNSGGSVNQGTIKYVPNENWQTVSITFNSKSAGNNNQIHLYHAMSTQTGCVDIEWVKLEKGDTATDWTPAPEDLESYIKEVEKITTQNSAGIEGLSDTVKIHGQKITTTEQGIKDLDGNLTNLSKTVTEESGRLDVAYDKIESSVTKINQDLSESNSKITQLSGEVSTAVTKVDIVDNKIDNTTVKITPVEGVEIWNNNGKGLTIYDNRNQKTIELTSEGHIITREMTAVNANITGNLTAGKIAGLVFNDSKITFPNGQLTLDSGKNAITFGRMEMKHSTKNIGGSITDVIDVVTPTGNIQFVSGVNYAGGSLPNTFISDAISTNSISSKDGRNNIVIGGLEGVVPTEFTGEVIVNAPITSEDDVVIKSYKTGYSYIETDAYAFRPHVTSGEQYLGTSGRRWNTIFSTKQPNISSDIRQKHSIQDIPQDLIEEISKVEPKMYLQHKTWHFGYIAQDIERALYKWATNRYGLEARHYVDKFAFLYKDESYLSLLYGEIAVLREKEMSDRITKLEQEIENLKELIQNGIR